MDRIPLLVALTLLLPLAASSLPAGAVVPTPALQLQEVANGFSNPLLVTHAGDGSGRVFVVEQVGRIYEISNGRDLYLDIRHKVTCCGERGLLGLAFAPDFAASGRLYVSYTGAGGTSVLERLTVADPATGTPPTSGDILLTQAQPAANHNGGHLAFGPDGYLYYGLGDGGGANDQFNNGQDPNTLLGALLRLDVSGAGYTIPPDNPFVGGGGRAEIYAYGLRNPWRYSFDRDTGDLWLADVGQNLVEEVNFISAGAGGGQNYGWPAWEGHYAFRPLAAANPASATMTFPVTEYNHFPHCSITGGYVYRGSQSTSLQGVYVYGDFCSGVIFGAVEAGGVVAASPVLLDSQYSISSFGEDEDGELYVVHHGGRVFKIVAA